VFGLRPEKEGAPITYFRTDQSQLVLLLRIGHLCAPSPPRNVPEIVE
jgi:hypothetical protein